ncbi:hypothetical protein CLOP_g24644 [Closterium sp. NIES-67]|nr:hypothetical protein CLOP_g24644 [Closterium sp. NIES-67]
MPASKSAAMQRRQSRLASFSAGLWLAAAAVSSCHAASIPIRASQSVFLSDCQKAWGTTIPGWSQTASCSAAQGLTCDPSGMITAIRMDSTNISGAIPDSISSLTALTWLDLGYNQLDGSIPAGFGNLPALQYLALTNNQLTGPIPAGIGNLPNLKVLYMGGNQLTGPIPDVFGNLTNLDTLFLGLNSLTGSIPNSITSLNQLSILSLASNSLTGSIPDSFTSLNQLSSLSLASNSLTGSIPNSITSLNQLFLLDLSANQLSGPIPAGIGNLTNLKALSFSNNSLTDSLPNSFTSLNQLTILVLSRNQLSGPIPVGIGNLTNLKALSFSNNLLTGSLPNSITSLNQLSILWLDNNSLSGILPNSLEVMSQLTSLGINDTSLNGTLPTFLGSFSSLDSLNISGTNLTCPPDYIACGSTQSPKTAFCRTCPSFCSTCGKPAPDSSTNSSTTSSSSGGRGVSTGVIIGVAVAAGVVLLLLIAVLLCFRHTMQLKRKALGTSLAAAHCTEFSLAEVLKATNNWSEDNQLGSGAFGDVYKGVSPRDGTTVWAVKRAKLIDVDFQREILQMADKNHPNIVRLLGFAVGGDVRSKIEQILIYEFVSNGDLHKWIDRDASNPLSFKQRLDILIGIARGFEYLHSFDIVHRDIKPANILITADMQAKIADFGLVRAGEGTTVGSTRIMGTPGYLDPVYSRTSLATSASDVYSFGVLMLVVLTGEAPIIESAGETRQITSWASECMTLGDLGSLTDSNVEAPGDAVLRLTQLAISCTVERTASRPSMAHIANQLKAIREEVAGKDELSAAVKVDAQVQEMKDTFGDVDAFEESLKMIGERFSNENHV